MNALYVAELDEINEMPEEEKQRFRVHDLSSLNWALRKMKAIDKKKAEINDMIAAEIERLENFRDKEIASLQHSRDFFQGLIAEYAFKKRDADPTFKSEKTPYGTIRFRKREPKWNYNDQHLVSFLKEQGYDELIRTKEEPMKTEIKKVFHLHDDGRVFDENGVEVEGITVDFLPDVFDVKVVAE